MPHDNVMEKILIGKIVNAVGLKGEVKVYNYSDAVDIYEDTEAIYVDDVLMPVRSVRMQKNMVVLGLCGIDDRTAAEKAKGSLLYVTEDDLPELPEGVYYVRDLIGVEAVLEDDSHLGKVKDVIQNTAQDIFEVETDEGKQVLVPKVPAFVLDIDIESRRVTLTLGKRAFAYYSVPMKRWHVEKGDFEILVGASSRDIRLKQGIRIEPPETEQYTL
jgi:16S rRNA processing protein RimM